MSSTLSRLKRECGISLETLQQKGASSSDEGIISWVFSSCGRKLGFPLELRRGPQGPTLVASGKSSLPSSCEGPLGIPLQSVQGHKCSSQVEAGTSGFLSSADMDLGDPMEYQQGIRPRLMWRHGTPLLSSGVKVLSGFLSSWPWDLWLFLKVPWGCLTSLGVLSRYLQFLSRQCRGIRLIWSIWGIQGIFKLRHDSRGCARVSR